MILVVTEGTLEIENRLELLTYRPTNVIIHLTYQECFEFITSMIRLKF